MDLFVLDGRVNHTASCLVRIHHHGRQTSSHPSSLTLYYRTVHTYLRGESVGMRRILRRQ